MVCWSSTRQTQSILKDIYTVAHMESTIYQNEKNLSSTSSTPELSGEIKSLKDNIGEYGKLLSADG